ncbi:MAG: hypothetical protein WDM89_22225 [Rhizomicrobium sp.]
MTPVDLYKPSHTTRMYDKIKFGLAKHLNLFDQKQLDIEVGGTLADLASSIDCMQSNLEALQGVLNAALYGGSRECPLSWL